MVAVALTVPAGRPDADAPPQLRLELRAMANLAAERVRTTGAPFVFGEMNSNERRIIHLTLADCKDLATESAGEGPARKVRVVLRPPT